MRSYSYQNSVFLLKGTGANLESLLLKRKCTQNSIEFSTKIRASESSRSFEIIGLRLISLPPDNENDSDDDDDDDDDEFDNSDSNNIFIC